MFTVTKGDSSSLIKFDKTILIVSIPLSRLYIKGTERLFGTKLLVSSQVF